MEWIWPLSLIAAGLLAASSLIIAKKPDAKAVIDKIAPYQATLGAWLLIWGLYNFFVHIGVSAMLHAFGYWMIGALTLWGMLVSGILLGVMFGIPMIAKLSPAGAAKAETMAKKLAPFQVLLGLVALGSALLAILINLSILKPPGM